MKGRLLIVVAAGITVIALIAVAGLLAHSPRFQALLEKSRQSIREGKGLSSDEFWEAVEKRSKR